jgi:hypothetical protein
LIGKVAAPVQKTEFNGREDSLRRPRGTLYPLRLILTSPTSGGRSVGIVRLRAKAMDFVRRPSFRIETTFRKWVLFLSSG